MGSARRRRRLLRTVLCELCLGAFVAALLTDLSARAGLRHQRSLLASAEARLGASEGVARGTLATFSSTLDERNLLDESVAQGAAQVASTGQTLNTASQSAFFATVHANEIHTCLGGVQGALGQIAASNTQGAATALAGVSATCLDLSGGSTSGLVYPFDFPDPFVLRVGSTYWGYATNSAAGNIQIITSSDLANWTTVGNALPALPSWAQPGATWAPSVIQLGATFVLYYAAATAASGTSCISVATASAPQGPFVDNSSAPLICQSGLGGSIDPSPFVDASGNPYLTWKSNGAGGQPATIWVQPLSASGTQLAGFEATPLLTPSQAWENGVVEAPSMFVVQGQYFLFYSGNNWDSADYAIGWAACQGPLGPCTKPSGTPLLASGPAFAGPGGPALFTDPSGRILMAFHAWAPGAVGYPNSRDLYVRPLTFPFGVPTVGPAS
jgi:beta-xylosidase